MRFNRHICIPEFAININEEPDIVLLLVKILSYQKKEVSVKHLIADYNIKRDQIKVLVTKGYLKIKDLNGDICVDISPIYNFEKIENEQVFISARDIEHFSFILGRSLKQFELEELNKFVEEGFEIKEIQTAIQKSVLNNVDSFNYIETVLKNSKKTPGIESNNIKRNIDIY